MTEIRSPLQGTVVSLEVAAGEWVGAGDVVMLVESMKMHHDVVSPEPGVVAELFVDVGTAVMPGAVLARLEPRAAAAFGPASDASAAAPVTTARADLAEVVERHDRGLDPARPDAVARRRASGRRTARENVADLVDDGSFVEYGPLVIAAQRRRRDLEDLIANTPADGMVGGIGTVNADLFGGPAARCVVVSYDYTVLAGTQGLQNHRKKDRLFELAERMRLPVVFFTEGGGGRPGDTDGMGPSGLDCMAFLWFAQLSGLVPLVGVNAGYCFAGNAAILGCCDVVIATEDSNIGMGGPAMIEGGGLGVFPPTDVGPIAVQRANGVVDVVVADEAEGVAVARKYLSYFQGRTSEWTCADQTRLREVVPADRLRSYDVRLAIDVLFDTGSVLELRRDFGLGMITAFARLEGRPVGVVANNPTHLAGAIDTPGADKAARFMQLCDAHDLPLITLCDTPGMMVGPDAEATALVRHCNRLFVTGANLTVPTATVVLRKAYGLGAQAMMGGSTKAPLACLAWPTGEFGGMGLEGAVRLGYRRELEAIDDPEGREELFQELVDRMYEVGKAISTASFFEIDDVVDPAETRRWLAALVDAAPAASAPPGQEAAQHRHLVSWLAVAGVATVVAMAATVQLAAGFGFALAAVPLLALVTDPHDAVVISLSLATLTNAWQAWTGRRDTVRGVTARLILGALAGMPLGLLVFVATDDRWLSVVIGVIVLVAVVVIARGLDLRHAGPGLDIGGGLVAGVLTLSTGVNGPPMVFVLQARHFHPAAFRSTITSVFTVLDVVAVTILALTGDLDADALLAVAVALPALLLGAKAGIALRRHLDPLRFRRLVLGLLVVAGTSTLVSALVR